MKFNEIIGALPTLTQVELATVKATTESLLEPTHPSGLDSTMIVFDALMKTLNIKMSFGNFNHLTIYKQWRVHASACLLFAEETFPPIKRSRNTKYAVLCFLLEILRDNLKAGRIPVTVGTMVTHMGRVPQAFEKAFPGYIESNATGIILERMKKQQ